MLLFALTSYGWFLIIVIIISLLLAAKVSKKMFKQEGGCLPTAFISLVIVCINLLLFSFALEITKTIYKAVASPKYSGIIVGSNAYEQKNSSGGRGFKYAIVYAPLVKYQTSNGETKIVESNIRSGSKPVIGEETTIVLSNNDNPVLEISSRGNLFLFGGSIFVLILGFVFYRIIKYAFTP